MALRKLIPDVIHDQDVVALAPEDSVLMAVKQMIEHNISAVVVTADGTTESPIIGIFTERDLTVRVVGAGRHAVQVRLGDVMTQNPDVLPPEARAVDALQFMRKRHSAWYRYGICLLSPLSNWCRTSTSARPLSSALGILSIPS